VLQVYTEQLEQPARKVSQVLRLSLVEQDQQVIKEVQVLLDQEQLVLQVLLDYKVILD